jgi:uncharacterized membrane protein
MNKLLKEGILWIFILLPFIYLLIIWDKLPETVPTHFNVKGEADGWSNKSMLLYLPCMLGIGIYLLLLLVPKIDPKNKLAQMGEKFYMIRFIIAIFISALSLYVLYTSQIGAITGINFFLLISGAFFAALGNYMQAMRPNYFVGIRTPWTLESEEVWKNTHRLGGKIWMIGGSIVVLLSILIQNQTIIMIVFLTIITVLVLVPIIYSYLEYRRLKINNE